MLFRRKNRQQQSNIPATKHATMPTYITMNSSYYKPYMLLSENNHLLVAGCTGSGKSVLINGIIITLLMTKTPYDCQFVLIDPKRTELKKYKNIPHCVKYSNNPDDIIAALKHAEMEMDRRYQIMETSGQVEFSGSELYIIIDELMDLMVTMKKQVYDILVRIALLGRSAKIKIIAGTQCLLAKIIPTEFKCNFPVIAGLRTATPQQSRYLVNSTGCELLPNPKTTGTSKALIRDGADLFPMDIYKYPDSEIDRVITHWTSKDCIA